MQTALVVLGAYLIGSVSFAIVLSRLAGMPDPRSYGSRNPGATNVLRSGRKLVAALTLAGDGAKGWLAVFLAQLWAGQSALAGADVPLAGVAVLLGHLFPAFHGFKGGKGVATAAGVLLGFNAWLGLATLATWAAIFAFFRVSSLAGLVAAVFAPVYAFWLFGLQPVFPAVIAIAVLIAWRHKENLQRLLSGAEGRVGEKSSPPPRDPSAGAP
ncbi:MAG: glycerol-3-phosphate 1-O-acyltransferase PlsY [Betaproteobacteria bacterium]|nr:glycerol-3-phosphate 1-O-acyltransferase PlsY [Betaproteobacteria bacterium]